MVENFSKATATYSKVQFIGFAISTTPGNLTSIEEMSDDGKYLGYEDINKDIQERIELLKSAITSAARIASKDKSVLKVFVVPEFYFRGNKGAYYGKA